VVILALANLDPVRYKPQIESTAKYIMARQNLNGSWDYNQRTAGDTSISQYGVLGLWEAENAGVTIPPRVWDNAASWYLSSQSGGGSWNYHRDEGGPETVAMTAAGVGSLLICERQLKPYRATHWVTSPLLIPIDQEIERRKYKPDVSAGRVTQGIQSGLGFLNSSFTPSNTPSFGKSANYALYGIERIGALANRETLGRRDWYADGLRFLASTQSPGGSFNGAFGDAPETAWAVLFLTKSTAKTVRKIQLRRLGAGTLVGGRGLPRDLSQISVAGGHVVVKPMDGAIEGMLAALEDPRIEDATSALAGLVTRYRAEGSKALRPYQDRFIKLLADPDPGVRRVAAWSLARTGDLAAALPLIEALKDPDDSVVSEVKKALQLVSRKLDDDTPPVPATPEQRAESVAHWRAWYESVRPSNVADDAATRPATTIRRGP
jgi:hypothetical protein